MINTFCLLFVLLFFITGCAPKNGVITEKDILKTLFKENTKKINKTCALAISQNIYRKSKLKIIKQQRKNSQIEIIAIIITPEIKQEDFSKVMKEALLEALKNPRKEKSLADRTCEILAKKVEKIPFYKFEKKCMLFLLKKKKDRKLILLHQEKMPFKLCQTVPNS